MFESLTTSKEDAINILKSDHKKVKELFDQFERAENMREKKKIAAEAIMELKIHAEIEEKIFYPAVRKGVDENIMNEADEEHHVAKLLIGELEHMEATDDHWEAKFTVLAENIRHHIKEEEGQMMPEARKEEIDFEELGQKLLMAKEKLKKNGVPESAEGKLMARGYKADSPAKAASGKPSLKLATNKPGKYTSRSTASSKGQASQSKRKMAKR
jgi:hypothetical protein